MSNGEEAVGFWPRIRRRLRRPTRALSRQPRCPGGPARDSGGQLRPDRLQQMARRVRDLLYGIVEGFLVLLRGDAISADLAHELQCGAAHLVLCRWLFWTA